VARLVNITSYLIVTQ